jgi:N-acetyl-anhydromuramyl-L-alanine amidase AmpD
MNHQGTKTPRRAGVVVSLCLGVLVVSLPSFADTAPAPTRDWQWIVIHHSATRTGNAEVFDASHRARGMINGLAYHFVIDNGSDGKADGFIETGARWVKQMQGGHCRQAYINEQGIGICLVGNFSQDQPTAKQLDSLAVLVRGLQDQFHIPDDHILGHGDVIGEFSECPGHEFPWAEFQKRLKQTDPYPVLSSREQGGGPVMDFLAPRGQPSRRDAVDVYGKGSR